MSFVRVSSVVAHGTALLALMGCGGATPPTGGTTPPNGGVAITTHPMGNLSTKIGGLNGRPFGIRVSPANVVYVTQQDANSVASFTLADALPRLAVSVGSDPGDVVFTHTGTTAFVSAFYGGSVHVIDVAGNRQTAMIPVSSNAYRLAISSNDATLFVSSTDGRVYAVSTSDLRVTKSVQLGGAIQGLALSPSGAKLIASSTSGSVFLLDAATLEIVASSATGDHLQDVVFSQTAGEIYVASENGWVDVLDASSLQRLSRITLDGMAPFGLALTPDDAKLYITSSLSGQVAIVDRRLRTLEQSFRVDGIPRRVAFNASGSIAVVANESNWVDVIR
ncbi:MAG: YncE family protein [bacterium]